MIKVGGTEITDVNLGSTPVQQVYLGSTLVWERNIVPPYDEIEYIECNGTQWIDTGVAVSSGMNVSLRYSVTIRDGVNNMLFGYIDGSTSTQNFVRPQNSIRSRWGGTKTYKDIAMAANDIFLFTVNNRSVVHRNETQNISVSYTAGTSFTSRTLPIGGVNNLGSMIITRGMRIYSAVIGNVRDLIPVRVGSVGYLYDRVSRQLIGNAGTGDFVLGPDVT